MRALRLRNHAHKHSTSHPVLLRRAMLALRGASVCGLIAVALAGCRSQQAAPGDPFLPFMRTRVPPPGTTVAPGAVGDPYYQGGAATTPPPATGAPPAGAGAAAPDKYSPRGGFNVPQSSIDRSKVVDPKQREVRTGATAIARRTLSQPLPGHDHVDTQLTAAKSSLPAESLALSVAETSAAIDSSVAFAEPEQVAQAEMREPTVGRATLTTSTSATQLSVHDGSSAEPDGGTTLRIVAPHQERELAATQPAGESPAAVTRLQMQAGAPTAQFTSKPVADRVLPANYSVPDGQANVQFHASQSDTAVLRASWNEPALESQVFDEQRAEQQAQSAELVVSPGSAPSSTPVERAAEASAPPAGGFSQPYGYDPSYGWLRGRLEYSQSSKQWKLRYIPIDGATDAFGGSVVLADAARLNGFNPGDFVTVCGAVSGSGGDARGFSPQYQLSQIDAVR